MLARMMLEFFDCIDTNNDRKYKIRPVDERMMQVWLAEAKFLSCFEDLFDLKFSKNKMSPDSVLSLHT